MNRAPPPGEGSGGSATPGPQEGSREAARATADAAIPSTPIPGRFAELHFAPAPQVSGRVPGPNSQRMLAEQAAVESRARSYPRAVPLALEEGRGATVKD